jgi:aminopeptidase YwaD
MKPLRLLSAFIYLALSSRVLAAEHRPLLDPKTRDLLHEALSGEQAKDHVIQITRHHRIQGSRGFRAAAQYVLGELRRYGFSEKDAFIESFPSDGKIVYQTWQSPSGWDVEWAELRMLEPYEERIVGYPEVAMSVITYSNAGDATRELVFVGAGTSEPDYEGKEVRDKFVLATGYGGAVHRLAVLKYGAAGVICFLDDERAKEYPDMLQYTGMWPKTEELERVTFGFNLTHRQGEKLKNLLASGKKVVLRGQVKGIGLEPYFMDVVIARIPGSEKPDEVLVFSAHLDHPKESANDNASGSAAILDIAGTLFELVRDGRLPRPRRTLEFMWVPEFYGTMAYLDRHPELAGPEYGGKYLANINMDMVGENLELLHTVMNITRTPASLPSVVNDVVSNLAEMVDGMEIRTPRGSLSQFNYRVTEYRGGSDHNVFIDRKIPGLMFWHDPDYTHHTSEDTPDKVDPVELERCELIAASAVLYLANLTAEQGVEVAQLAAANAARRLGLSGLRAQRHIAAASGEDAGRRRAEAENILVQTGAQEKKALADLMHFNAAPEVKATVARLTTEIDRQLQALKEGLGKPVGPAVSREKPDGRVPVRLQRGPVNEDFFLAKLPPEERDFMSQEGAMIRGTVLFELVNFIDGKRTVSEIASALSAEFEPFDPGVVARAVENLARAGLVDIKP